MGGDPCGRPWVGDSMPAVETWGNGTDPATSRATARAHPPPYHTPCHYISGLASPPSRVFTGGHPLQMPSLLISGRDPHLHCLIIPTKLINHPHGDAMHYRSTISTASSWSPGRGSRPGSRSRIELTTSIPKMTRPKTACLPFRCGVGTWVMKNWDPLVFGPAFAMDRMPGRSCLSARALASSSKR